MNHTMLQKGGGQNARATVARAFSPEPCTAIWYHVHNSGRRRTSTSKSLKLPLHLWSLTLALGTSMSLHAIEGRSATVEKTATFQASHEQALKLTRMPGRGRRKGG
jgi:hypothetical protein